MMIGLVGKKGSGKTTVARILAANFGFVEMSFALPLKKMMHVFYESCGLTDGEINARLAGELKEIPDEYLNGKTPRHAMQTLGTEWGRNLISPTIWADTLGRASLVPLTKGQRVVVSDVRFLNEAETIHTVGGTLVRVVRNIEVPGDEHPSETEMDQIEVSKTLNNDSTLEELQRNVNGLMNMLRTA